MNAKPVTPRLHGFIDYTFAGIQLLAPALLRLNKPITQTYQALGAGFLAVNAVTDTPVGVKPLLSFRGHQRADAGFLASLSLLTLAPFIRRDRAALTFHLGFLATAITHYVLTDYGANDVPDAVIEGAEATSGAMETAPFMPPPVSVEEQPATL